MLINFSLVPVQKIQPWGSPGNLSLSWFGLTDGAYWLRVGESTLFEYSPFLVTADQSRYCTYQVVRLYEDLIEMLPHILEPVPVNLVQYLSGDTANAWRETYRAWCDRNCDRLENKRFDEIIHGAVTWAGARCLDSAYLSPSANIICWSDSEDVYFEWDNRYKLFNGRPAWSALRGTYRLPRDQFVAEIQSFHDRLIKQMSARIEQVLSGAISSEINIDLCGLVREHEQRSRTIDIAVSFAPATDWVNVERSINKILRK